MQLCFPASFKNRTGQTITVWGGVEEIPSLYCPACPVSDYRARTRGRLSPPPHTWWCVLSLYPLLSVCVCLVLCVCLPLTHSHSLTPTHSPHSLSLSHSPVHSVYCVCVCVYHSVCVCVGVHSLFSILYTCGRRRPWTQTLPPHCVCVSCLCLCVRVSYSACERHPTHSTLYILHTCGLRHLPPFPDRIHCMTG